MVASQELVLLKSRERTWINKRKQDLALSEDALLAELITCAYKTVWTEYSAWSLRDSAATLKSLAVAKIRPTDADKGPNLYVAHISGGDETFLVADFDNEAWPRNSRWQQ